MLSVLVDILCWVKQFGAMVLSALVSVVNLVVAAIGAAVSAIVGALPAMPAPPSPPSGGVLAIVNYVLPLGGLLAGLAVALALWTAFLVIRVPLKWLKVL